MILPQSLQNLSRRKRRRDRALFDLAVGSKLLGREPAKIKIGDLASGGNIRN
jgi:hypothetical protein